MAGRDGPMGHDPSLAWSHYCPNHGTTEASGSRICVAQYMRDNVVERLGIESPGWMTMANYGIQ